MAERLHVPGLIARKRDGEEIEPELLRQFMDAYLQGEVGEEQMAAFLMAGVLRGFSRDEAVTLTDIYVASGEVVDLSGLRGPTVDKHSTGGVGDTCTLVVAPLLAACGAQVAKLSGRGLGHTGGTLDKLEAIPGFRVDLDVDEVAAQVDDIGLAVAAATQNLVPLDKRLYALRDVTGTVPSPALIAASVMSKKIAGGAHTIVLDVKTGDGAFMREASAAADLARQCVEIGEAHGRRTSALVTDMSQPLSPMVGNAIEVRYAIDVLTGRVSAGRFVEVCKALAVEGLVGVGQARAEAESGVDEALADGSAAERFRALVAAQGGDPDVVDRPEQVLPAAPVVRPWMLGSGTVTRVHCRALGELAAGLGAGRSHKDDQLDPRVGLQVHVSIGDDVSDDTVAVEIHAANDDDAAWAAGELGNCFDLGDTATPPTLIHERIGGST